MLIFLVLQKFYSMKKIFTLLMFTILVSCNLNNSKQEAVEVSTLTLQMESIILKTKLVILPGQVEKFLLATTMGLLILLLVSLNYQAA